MKMSVQNNPPTVDCRVLYWKRTKEHYVAFLEFQEMAEPPPSSAHETFFFDSGARAKISVSIVGNTELE